MRRANLANYNYNETDNEKLVEDGLITELSPLQSLSLADESPNDALKVTEPVVSYHRDLKPLLYLILPRLKSLIEYTSSLVYNSAGQPLHLDQFPSTVIRQTVKFLESPVLQETEELLVQLSLRQTSPMVIEDFWDIIGYNNKNVSYENEFQDWLFSEVRGWCALPLVNHDMQLMGVVVLRHTRRGYFTPEKVRQARFTVTQAISAQMRLWSQAQAVGVLKERQRIARELHDSVTQVLYGIELGINTALTLLDRNSPQVKPQLQDVLALAEAGLAEMRALLTELHPAALATEGLLPNLLRQVDALRVRHGVEVTHNLEQEPNIPLLLKEALFRITQEAFNNIVKHAQATKVELKLSLERNFIRLEVKDNGQGFDPNIPRPGHLGQLTMRERAADVGGKVEIVSCSGQGTVVRALLPLPIDKN